MPAPIRPMPMKPTFIRSVDAGEPYPAPLTGVGQYQWYRVGRMAGLSWPAARLLLRIGHAYCAAIRLVDDEVLARLLHGRARSSPLELSAFLRDGAVMTASRPGSQFR